MTVKEYLRIKAMVKNRTKPLYKYKHLRVVLNKQKK